MDFRRVTQQQLASALGKSARTIRNWEDRGIPRREDGSYSLPLVVQWLLDESRAESMPETEEAQRWLGQFRKERALITGLERRRLEAELIPTGEIRAAWTARMAAVSSMLQSLGKRLPPMLEGLPMADMTRVIDREVTQIKDTYCRTGKFTPAADERAGE